jgi:hypothetical protein
VIWDKSNFELRHDACGIAEWDTGNGKERETERKKENCNYKWIE